MDNSGAPVPSTKTKKSNGTGTRRTWKHFEEVTLMELLKEFVASGVCKSGNGFRPGMLLKLEDKLRDKLKGTDIRANPHIHSRITIWKWHKSALQTALSDSGSGFNTETKIIDVSNIAWDKAIKRDPTVAFMRYKPWHFHNDWLEVFGNDGAIGSASQTIIDAVNDVVAEHGNEEASASNPGAGTAAPSQEEDGPCEMDVESQAPPTEIPNATSSVPTSINNRASQSPPTQTRELLDGLSVLFKTSDDRLADVVHSFGVRVTSQPGNITELFGIMETIPNLTLDEQLIASELIMKNKQRWEFFKGLPDHARPRYVRKLLMGEFNQGWP